MKKIILFFLFLLMLGNVQAQKKAPIYSFFAAGHTYGSPMNPHFGLHYPFVNHFPDIDNYPNMKLGFLTGDVVVHSTAAYWDSAQIDIDKLSIPVFIAAGNHDMGGEFVDRYGDYYFSFNQNNDLFIVLTPGLGSWSITGNQLEFLTNTLESNYSTVNNIFIFMHELIWWSPENEYRNIKINYEPHYPGSTNFESVVKPLLLSYPNKITIYAGDLGATAHVSPFMYHKFDNITLIASGMGGGFRDNIIVTEVYEDSVYYNLVAINGNDPKALGELVDFVLSQSDGLAKNNSVRIYPNPCKGFFRVTNKYQTDLKLYIYDVYGKLLLSKQVLQNSTDQIEISGLTPGLYLIRFFGEDTYFEQKIIVK